MTTHFHFLGICGTAMGAVASAMAKQGFKVTGSDEKVYPPMSTFLEEQGIRLFNGFSPSNIPDEADIIVVGNAMSRGNVELEAVLNRKLRYMSMPETIKEFVLRGKRNFVVTGTHGKTTTTSMLTWLMEYAGLAPSFMIGGIAANLKCGGRFNDSDFCVLEGDEYDTAFFDKRSKFLHYLPELVVINNIEFDHSDIYDSVEQIKKSFKLLLRVVPGNGMALVNADDANCLDVIQDAPCPVRTVGLGDRADIRIEDIEYAPEGSSFTIEGARYAIPMVGEFNVRNAAMAVTAARFAGLEPDLLAEGLLAFEGVARRQQVKGVVNGITVVDDFAHHPTAIRQAVLGLRQRYPSSHIWGLFEPRSNTTRRNIFQKELADAMATTDYPVISSIEHPEKIKRAEDRLNLDLLGHDIGLLGKKAFIGADAIHIAEYVASNAKAGDVILVMSNGGFDGIHEKLLRCLAAAKGTAETPLEAAVNEVPAT